MDLYKADALTETPMEFVNRLTEKSYFNNILPYSKERYTDWAVECVPELNKALLMVKLQERKLLGLANELEEARKKLLVVKFLGISFRKFW